MALYKVPTQNSIQYTLDAQLAAAGTSLTLNQSVAGIVQAPGIGWVDRIDAAGNKTPTKREYFSFTGVSGAQLTGLTRGLAGSTDQVHAVGAIVEFGSEVVQQQAIYDFGVKDHTADGVHASLASLTILKTVDLFAASTASIQTLRVIRTLEASGASLSGVWPSGASGGVLTHNGNNTVVFAPSGGGTGGFNGLFQVPGALASTANIGGLIPVPVAFTGQFLQGYVQTPASLASVWVQVNKNNAIYGVLGFLAGATFASSASIASAALAAGDFLTLDIKSTASAATDLSVLLRAT